jgi:hypothetical protein
MSRQPPLARAPGSLGTSDAYRRRFRLRYRNNHTLKKSDYPLARVIAGETFKAIRPSRS